MTEFKVMWSKKSVSQLKKLDKKTAKRIIEKVTSITTSPYIFVKSLFRFKLYSLRAGDYRVILSIEGKKMIIFIISVGHRKKIYRKY